MGVDEDSILGKKEKFLTVGQQSGSGRASLVRQGTQRRDAGRILPEELQQNGRGGRLKLPAWDMWEPFTKSILKWSPGCRIVFDKFHVMQHANDADR